MGFLFSHTNGEVRKEDGSNGRLRSPFVTSAAAGTFTSDGVCSALEVFTGCGDSDASPVVVSGTFGMSPRQTLISGLRPSPAAAGDEQMETLLFDVALEV